MWAHVKRNLQQMADYSGGHTAYIGKHVIFRATPPIFNKSNSPGERVLCFRIVSVTRQADATRFTFSGCQFTFTAQTMVTSFLSLDLTNHS